MRDTFFKPCVSHADCVGLARATLRRQWWTVADQSEAPQPDLFVADAQRIEAMMRRVEELHALVLDLTHQVAHMRAQQRAEPDDDVAAFPSNALRWSR